MIAIQKIGKSFMGALNYNLKKMYRPDIHKRAKLLATNFESMDNSLIGKEVKLVCALRPNLSRYVYHTSLNFSKEELKSLSNEMLRAIALDYLEQNGFSNNQYFIFRHYDADHPHIHLLVNRIGFDGNVVSDSNNYKKSEAILRKLEYQYNLLSVEQSSFRVIDRSNNISKDHYNFLSTDLPISVSRKQYNGVSRKSPTRDEIAMILRTGKSSNKMLLQELLKHLIKVRPGSISEFIRLGEQTGIHFHFNVASTGRVSGITYFFKDFKAKGQALGHQFKWGELIKQVRYNPETDNPVIAEENKRTLAQFGVLTDSGLTVQNGFAQNTGTGSTVSDGNSEVIARVGEMNGSDIADAQNIIQIQIGDDIDDEAVLGKQRRRLSRKR